jgi:hypothetical protein
LLLSLSKQTTNPSKSIEHPIISSTMGTIFLEEIVNKNI